MNSKALKGIALLLFGILLCAGSEEINGTILYNFGDFPLAAIGVLVGAVGLYMVFSDKARVIGCWRHICRPCNALPGVCGYAAGRACPAPTAQ